MRGFRVSCCGAFRSCAVDIPLITSCLKPALTSDWHDIEDYFIAHSASRVGADYLVTRDNELAAKSPVKAMTASEVLSYLEKERGLVYDEVTLSPDE